MKRLIILCDGTLEDADSEPNPQLYTNIGRLSRAIKELDNRNGNSIEQIKFYLGGVGTEDSTAIGGYVAGALGTGMMDLVKNVYSFLSLNWESGDEIFLFGYSRGAYTVRLVASLISVIGILDPRKTLQFFPKLFKALDQRSSSEPSDFSSGQQGLESRGGESIQKLLSSFSKEKREQDLEYRRNGKFLIKFMGLFDTVATRGRPSTLRRLPTSPLPSIRFDSFGFDETRLETCIENAFQALALDEFRIDYLPVIWSSNPLGRPKGQHLQQVWFSGSHADVGGGYKDGDLSFITLWWMLNKLEPFLDVDWGFLKGKSICGTTMENFGKMPPHKSRVGQFLLTKSIQRPIPLTLNPSTNEYIHFSVKFQPPSQLRSIVSSTFSNPDLFTTPGKLEEDLRLNWPTPYLSFKSSYEKYKKEKKKEKSLSDSEQNDYHTDEDQKDEKKSMRSSSTSTSPTLTSFSDEELEKQEHSSLPSSSSSSTVRPIRNLSIPNHPCLSTNSYDSVRDEQDFSASNFRETQLRLFNPQPHSHHSSFLSNPFKAMRRGFRKKIEEWGDELKEREVRKEDEEEWREVERQLRKGRRE
ncbi:hypothetical protein JCM5350_007511 [Sporobolomyces pararoseus]